MNTRLLQVVNFPSIAPTATVALPHQINVNGVAQAPDFVAADAAGFDIGVTATTVTVTNNNGAPTPVNVWLELKHSVERELGRAPTGLTQPSLVPRPFVASPGGAGGGGNLFPRTAPILGDFTATAMMINQVQDIPFTQVNVTLPPANSVPNGGWVGVSIAKIGGGSFGYLVSPGVGDTLNSGTDLVINVSDTSYAVQILVSDGANDWSVITSI